MSQVTKDSILSYLRDNKEMLYEKFGIVRIGLFGSYVSDHSTPESDIDLVIEMDKEKKNIHNFLSLKRHLEEEFEKKVDLGFEGSMKPRVKEKNKENIIYV